VAIRYVLQSFGIFFPVLVCCTKKNLATLGSPCATIGGKKQRDKFSDGKIKDTRSRAQIKVLDLPRQVFEKLCAAIRPQLEF
jgi:hypothetical protein